MWYSENFNFFSQNPAIANHLLKNNIMNREACLDILAKRKQYSFMVKS